MRIRGITMMMMVLSMMTPGKMDWEIMGILMGLARMRMLPVKFYQ